MSEISFQRFIDLVEFDQVTQALEKELCAIKKTIAADLETIVHCSEKIEGADQKLRHAKLVVKEKESYIQELDQQQKQKEAQLDRVTNQREYSSVSTEIERLKNKQHAFESEVVDSWTALDSVTRETKAIQQEMTKKIEEMNAHIEEQKNALAAKEQAISERTNQREEMLENVPPELLEKYNAMRLRIVNPIVPVIHGSCSACFTSIAQTSLARLRSKVLEQCKGCFRFLYLGTS